MNAARERVKSADPGCLAWLLQRDPAKHMDARNSKNLKKWAREEQKIVKLLLLGTGESGKSTVSKQLKIIHLEQGFTDKEREDLVPFIRKNISDAILTILGAMANLRISLEHAENQSRVDYVMNEAIKEDFNYPQEFYDHVIRLWADRGVLHSYSRAHEYQLIDSAKYFLDKVDIVRQSDYMPSNQDILRNRVMTNTIMRMDFSVHDRGAPVEFSVYDVGGQRGERRKWIQVFESVTAIMFVLDCSCFDLTLREDLTRNRLIEAISTFEQTWNNKFLSNVSVLLFLNKIDLLEEKIRHGKSLRMLIDNMEDGCPYKEEFQQYYDWPGPKEGEVEEFVNAFPSPEGSSNGRRKKADLAQTIQEKQISEDTVRAAVFIKRLVMHLTTRPSELYRRQAKDAIWHEEHSCEYYYTCAVDTNTIQKVFEGSRALLIQNHLYRIGISS